METGLHLNKIADDHGRVTFEVTHRVGETDLSFPVKLDLDEALGMAIEMLAVIQHQNTRS